MLNSQLNASTITDAGYRIWLAHYTTNTDYSGTFDFWQYSSQGKVNGISGNVDMNFYYAQEKSFTPDSILIVTARFSPISDQEYSGNAITPPVSISYLGNTLTNGSDYTVQYSDNIKPGVATITVTGKGKFLGEKKIHFNIFRYNIADAQFSTIPDQAYSGNAITPPVSISYLGKPLTEGLDYTVQYSDNTEPGVATITVTGKGDYYGTKKEIPFNIVPCNIANAQFSTIPDQAYSGNAITPPVSISYLGNTLTEGLDYTVQYSDNIKPGVATITVTGLGRFCGEKKIQFNIISQFSQTALTVKAKKRSKTHITLQWTKDAEATGYQIWRSASLNGTYQMIQQISTNSTVTYKNTGLTRGQCYYYKVRSYKNSGGETYYSPYSPVAAIYTKLGYSKKAIAKKGTKLYASASSADAVVSTPAKNTSMTVTYSTKDDKNATWYRVSYKSKGKTYTGFVRASKVTIKMTGKVTKTNIVNVHKSVGTSSKKLTTLKKNQKVTVLKTKTKKGVTWYQVTFKKSGKTYKGWIASPYLKLI